jgi:hypothetical protein
MKYSKKHATFYASGAAIYLETQDDSGNKTQRWFASTQCEPGVPPTARELDDAQVVARMLDSHGELLGAIREAHTWIADTQRKGCPAGVVAVPSCIRDALRHLKT